jgi:phenylpyruvate tautomerase PptA (4-oxalocrotonate tautomerase family)
MPMFFIDVPQGLQAQPKAELIRRVSASLAQTYGIPDVRFFLREHDAGNIGQNGTQGVEKFRIACFLEVPPLKSIAAKRRLVEAINTAVRDAYDGIANTEETMVFFNEYPMEQVSWAGRMQADVPEMVDIAAKLQAA